MRLTLILPVYNEHENLSKNFPRIYEEVKRIGDSEIIIAENGSTDDTLQIAKKFARLRNVRVLSPPHKQRGRGIALKTAIKAARGNVIGYIDIDLAVPLNYIPIAMRHVEEGNKVVVGARYERESRVSRDPMRLFASVWYNFLVFLLLGSRIRDHQCGFKFWDSGFIKGLLPEIKDTHWFFDTEMIVRSEWKGVQPLSMPVSWKEQEDTKVKPSDVTYYINIILKLRAERKRNKL